MYNSIKISSRAEQGQRTYMEDEILHANNLHYYLSAVFDGHGGKRTSKFLKDHFVDYFESALAITGYDIRKSLFITIKQINQTVLQKSREGWTTSGSTANVVVICKKSKRLFLLNVGDSRTIICQKDNSGWSTKDHKASDNNEQSQIYKRGGYVSQEGRVMGTLLLSRAVGDIDVSKVISCQPEIFVRKINKKMRFLIQATDGLYDVLSNSQLCRIVNHFLDLKWSNKQIVDELMRIALKVKRSQDNTSIVLITFV